MPTRFAAERLDHARAERVLAVGRAFLTVAGLFAIFLDPTEPKRLQATAYSVLSAYAIYGLAAMFFVYRASRLTRRHVAWMHAGDIIFASILTFVSEGPVSAFFLFFLFVMLSAAFRWAFRETFATSVVVVIIFLAQTAIAAASPWRELFVTSEPELNRIIFRTAYLMITGVLFSYLAEQDKRSRAEMAAIAELARQPRIAIGLSSSMHALARQLLVLFRADSVVLVIQDAEAQRTMRWAVTNAQPQSTDVDAEPIELDAQQRDEWLFEDGGAAWHASMVGDNSHVLRVSVPGSWRLRESSHTLPAPLLSLPRPTSIVAGNFGLAGEWKGRIYIVGTATSSSAEQSVHLLESIIDYVTPGVTNVLLMRRLRQRAGADERARVARELHDGTIQALFGLEMKIEALRRGDHRNAEVVDAALAEVQGAVRHEVQELRDLMQALRPVQIEDAAQLPEVISSLVERFRRDTGISARFVATGDRISLSPAASLEMVRIIQEALVNVRKHSHGRNVLVRIEGGEAGCCKVTIEDDGDGFEFEGRVTAEEMERRRIGPAIIRERARIARAGLIIESLPGQGARLELTFAADTP